ncbi:MAG: PTS sugar transporter subunit IIA [Pseudomonadota bacterium]
MPHALAPNDGSNSSSVAALLAPERCLCQVQGTSKKRLFELIADLLSSEYVDFHPSELVSGMLAREKLGSTALGEGIAIPHCRLDACETPCGVLLTLDAAADFDAPDNQDVDLVFALVVPGEATQEHLNLLADLARLFSKSGFREALRGCATPLAVYETALQWSAQLS